MERYIEKIKEEYPFFAALSLLYGIIFTVSLYENISGITFPICIGITIIFIKIFLCTGMNDQLFYRILIINIHKFRKFLTTFCSDPRFYRNIDRAIFNTSSRKRSKRSGNAKKPAPRPFVTTVLDGHPTFRLISLYPYCSSFFAVCTKSSAQFVNI